MTNLQPFGGEAREPFSAPDRRPWSAADDAVALRLDPRDAAAELGRTYMAIVQRRSILRNPEPAATNPGAVWTASECRILKARYPVAESTADLLKYLPRFTPSQIRSKAHHMGLRRKFFGDADCPIDGHKELIDQIRVRAKSDGVALCQLDRTLGTGSYFKNWKRERVKVNLRAVAKAIEFFGGTLVIDWRDR